MTKSTLMMVAVLVAGAAAATAGPEQRLVGYADGKPLYVNVNVTPQNQKAGGATGTTFKPAEMNNHFGKGSGGPTGIPGNKGAGSASGGDLGAHTGAGGGASVSQIQKGGGKTGDGGGGNGPVPRGSIPQSGFRGKVDGSAGHGGGYHVGNQDNSRDLGGGSAVAGTHSSGGAKVHMGSTRITHGGRNIPDNNSGYTDSAGYGYGYGYGNAYGYGSGHGVAVPCGPIRVYNPAQPIPHPFPAAAAAGYANVPRYAP